MKTLVFLLSLALSIQSFALTDEYKKYLAEFKEAEIKALAMFPDIGVANSKLRNAAMAIDAEWESSKDPRYQASNKPMLTALMAAKELGIAPVGAEQKPQPKEGTIPVLNQYRNVTIKSVEPDGLRVMHESGAAKIPFEEVPQEYRDAYKLTVEGARAYRKSVAEYAAYELAVERQAKADKQARAAELRAAQVEAASRLDMAEAQSQAAVQDVVNHHKMELEQGRRDAADSQRRFQEQDREMRLDKLERDSRDRLNRERTGGW